MNILSLGAGVQSSTLLLMALEGELEEEFGKLDAAIFSDTGWEPATVYEHLNRLESAMETGGVPLYRVSRGNIHADALDPHRRKASMPFHMRNEKGEPAKMRRQCTSEYKIEVIEAKIRELIGLKKRQRAPKTPVVTQWIGISLDEVHRMKDSRTAFIRQAWPLIDRRMSRHDCQRWLHAHGWHNVPKSSCIGCPFHDSRFWRDMKDNAPDEFAEAVAFDEAIRGGTIRLGIAALRGQAFLHRDLIPLSEVDLSTPEDHGQLDMFGDECSGHCGV